MVADSVGASSAATPGLLRRVEAVVFFTVFLDLVGFGIVIPMLPFYVQSMGGSARTVGILLGCFSFTQLLATPLLGRYSDRHGRRAVILLSLLANAVAMALFALASHQLMLPLLFASRILAGATSGNIAACQAALADVTTKETRARAMGRIGAGIGLGMVLGPTLGGLFSGLGPWVPPLLAGGLALVGFVAAFFAMPETHPVEKRVAAKSQTRWSALQDPSRRKALGMVLGLFFAVFLSMTTLQVAFALLVQARLGWGSKEVGYTFAVVGGLGMVIQGGLIGPLSRAAGEFKLLICGALLLAGGMAGLAVSWQAIPMMLSVVLVGVGMGFLQPLISSQASQVAPPSQQGAVLGLAQSCGGLARTVGPVASGWMYASWSTQAPFLTGMVSALAAAGLGVLLHRETGDDAGR
ncbi:MFS transporter [Corallococcus sp. AB004]|uniref:MFS transporter n=1 Tax=Corallococcus TaxID=83461 RepID=UPI000EA31FA6|nr:MULTISPECIES: MFS transporter [Corallococcus]NPC71959.1 MFS transporter [Corallococcus exiguus]NRD47731.1 MFS transporter [Corallococcus exiguus]RKI04855.1 MFS transporter [Corallococcus sp. AB038B]RKI36013.1 MFS transporter [Corallococcus sp. AB004]